MSTKKKLTRNLNKKQLGSVIFGCTATTMKECLDKKLFGLPSYHFSYISKIDVGLPLFLFNYTERTLHGIFKATCQGKMNIDMYAWTGDGASETWYPAQVKVDHHLRCEPLSEVQFKPMIIGNYYDQKHFWFELDKAQTQKLMSKFSSLEIRPIPPAPRSLPYPKWSDALTERGKGECSKSSHPKEESVDPWCSDETWVASDTSPCLVVEDKVMDASGDEEQENVIVEELILSRECPDADPSIKGKEVENESADDSDLDWEAREDNKVGLEKGSSVSSDDLCDYPAMIAQLRSEMEELKIFKREQTTKIEHLERLLAGMKDEYQKLEDRCMRLESTSSKSMDLPGENDWKLNESILIVGGYDGASWLPALDLFSPSRDLSKSLKPMSCARAFASAVKLYDEVYVCGGGYSYTMHETVESYNVVRDQWTPRPSLSKKKGCLGCEVLNGRLYAVGGGDFTDHYSDVEMYDPNLGKWIASPSMRQKRFGLAVAELNGAIYAIGGYDGSAYLKTAERFDPRQPDWSRIEDMAERRGVASLVALNEKLYAIGGYNGTTMVSSAEVYEPCVGKWRSVIAMNSRRGYMSAVVLDRRIYAIGGVVSGEEVLDTIEVYKENGDGWEMKSLKAVGKRSFASAVVFH